MEDTPIHSPYKTLIVDDSAIVRGLVTRMMSDDAEIEVIGSVSNGEEALSVMEQGGVEVIVLDIEMPVMDGLTALPKLLEIDPTVRVIMASTLTKRNADISFQAMTLGAVDYIPKPSSSKDLNVGAGFRAELLDKVKAWAEQRRKMLEVEEAATAAAHADAEPTHEDDHAPEEASAHPAEADHDHPADDGHHDGKQGPFRAEMSVEHQQLQKQGRIQRKRFTAELRPRPMQQHPRPQAMQMRQAPVQPHHPAPQTSASSQPQNLKDNSPADGVSGTRSAAVANSIPTRPQTPSRDPGRLIRDAAIAAGGAPKSASATPTRPMQASPAAAPRRAAANASEGATKPGRLKGARDASAPAPVRRPASRGEISLLPEKRVNVEAIAIGSSTGGPQALFEVLRGLNGVRQPIFITQHMPATFTTILAEHITRLTGLKCQEGKNNMPIVGGQVYLAPGDYHMTVEGRGGSRHLMLNQNAPENFCRPSVDPMLRSLVASYGGNILTAILTGMGQDGMLGGRDVVNAGGMVVAQDEQSSVVWGMPGAAAHAGICSAVLPVGGIAAYIKKFAGGR
ncbi:MULTISPECIES: chemotaxis protein CheB [Thalassospira]|uniref:Protein-glutamate methylesterase/protein-glutamine glutaminase n=2 Tax=Thalassospira TaxID=168934 RepID=A0A367W2U8_9PROT|nr:MULTISPECIES: chemotaxis protein CheB [Thalassospira]MDG4718340.1 chemotaxis protein CheB [Thalassospira sp. FZY0004]RCK34736.1 chemotaxis protein [Thalassospira profundimaris]